MNTIRNRLFIVVFLSGCFLALNAQEAEPDEREYPNKEDNSKCLVCHEGDDVWEKYNFAGVIEEYEKSHQTKLTNTKYSCWSCHDQHGFLMQMREETKISKLVVHDNAMCL